MYFLYVSVYTQPHKTSSTCWYYKNVIRSSLLDKCLFCTKQKLWAVDMTKWTKSNPLWKLCSVQMLKAYAHCSMKSNFINYWATFSHLKKASSKDKATADTDSPPRALKKKKKGILTSDKFWHWRMLAQKYSLFNLDCFVALLCDLIRVYKLCNTNDHTMLPCIKLTLFFKLHLHWSVMQTVA